MGESSRSWELRAHCTACRQLNRLESVFSRCLSWSKHLPAADWFLLLLSCWSQSLLCSPASFCLRGTQLLSPPLAGQGLVSLLSFREFLKSLWLFIFLLKELPCWREHFDLGRDCYTTFGLANHSQPVVANSRVSPGMVQRVSPLVPPTMDKVVAVRRYGVS